MTSRIAASVSRALRRVASAPAQHDVHFHVDSPGGRTCATTRAANRLV